MRPIRLDRSGAKVSAVTIRRFLDSATADPANAALLSRLAALRLDQCMLTAGCLFQAVWNERAGHPPGWGVKDYDVFYFDAGDLSWDGEDAVIRRGRALFGDLDVTVEIKNQARVHLWHERRFGAPYPQLGSSRDGIDRYLVAGTCVGIDVASGELYAPNGLQDVYAGVLRPNPLTVNPSRFQEKARDSQLRWPWLTVV